MKKYLYILGIAASLLNFTSCSEDDLDPKSILCRKCSIRAFLKISRQVNKMILINGSSLTIQCLIISH